MGAPPGGSTGGFYPVGDAGPRHTGGPRHLFRPPGVGVGPGPTPGWGGGGDRWGRDPNIGVQKEALKEAGVGQALGRPTRLAPGTSVFGISSDWPRSVLGPQGEQMHENTTM